MSDIDNSNFAFAKRISSIIYVIVTNKYATLKELRDDYDIYELLDMYEMIRVSNYNRAVMIKSTRRS